MNIPENFDRWMFDYKEGNLSGAEKASFENFLIQNPQFEVEADAWNNSFVENEEFVYPNAGALEKDNRVIGIYGWAAAAVALLLIGTSVFFLTQNSAEVEGFTSTDVNVHELALEANNASISDIDEHKSALIDELANLAASNDGVVGVNIANNIAYNANNGASGGNNINGNNGSSHNFQNNNHLANNGNGLNNVPNNNNQNNLLNGSQSLGQSSSNGNVMLADNSAPGMTDPTVNKKAFDQEIAKYGVSNHNTRYQGNPDNKDLAFDVAKKENYDWSSWRNKMKRLWRKVERAFDVPPANLTNLGDPEILMPNTSALAFNPGFVGGMNGTRFDINYRNQWFGNDQNSQEMTVSIDKYVPQMRGGVGIIMNAKDYGYGAFGDYNVSLVYSPKILFGTNIIFEPAVKMTLGALNGNGEKLAEESAFEMNRGRILTTPAAQQMQGNQQLWYKDYGLGFVLNTKKFYVGFSADNLNRHYENVYNEEGYATPTSSPVLMNAIAGFDFENDHSGGKKVISASPFVAYQQFGDRKEIWGGANMRFGDFTIGGSMNHKLDFTAAIGMKFEKFKMVYHYDHTRSVMSDTQIGSHNLGIRFNTSSKPRKVVK